MRTPLATAAPPRRPGGRRRALGLAAAAVAAAALAGCAPVDLLNATIPEDGFTVTRDIAYGPGSRQRLDVYQPARRGPARPPVVVFLYGGGWTAGDKADYLFVAEALTGHGWIAVVADYRVFPQVVFPGFVQDSAAAVGWTLDQAAGLGGDPSRVFVMGHSAGAYNAAMLASDARWLAATGHRPADLAGMIGLAGPYDFWPLTSRTLIRIFGGPDRADAQPIAHVDGDEPPMLLLAGADDGTVAPGNTLRLAAAVDAAGGRVAGRLVPDTNHAEVVLALAAGFRAIAPVLPAIADFIDDPGSVAGPPHPNDGRGGRRSGRAIISAQP